MTKMTFFQDDTSCMYPFGTAHSNGKILVGALTLAEYWVMVVDSGINNLEQGNGQNVLSLLEQGQLNDRWLPTASAIKTLAGLHSGADLYFDNTPLFRWNASTDRLQRQFTADAQLLSSPTQLFSNAGEWITEQVQEVVKKWSATSASQIALPSHVNVIGPLENLFIAPGAKANACTINTEAGPVLLGPESEIQEGSNIRGPLYVGANSVIKMGSKVYGPTSIGEECRIGGEVSNSVFLGFANKGHDGFVGNSVIGHWCNLGAATNTSNLKSNYSSVRLWDESTGEFNESGLQFCGLIMGDHSKSGINTMFNTGSVVGVGCNVFGSGFQPKHIPPFSWGGGTEWQKHEFEKFIQTVRSVMARRGYELLDTEIELLKAEYKLDSKIA